MFRATDPQILEQWYSRVYAAELLLSSPETTHIENKRTIRYLSEFLSRPAEIDDLQKETILAYRVWRLERGAKQKRGTNGRRKSIASAKPRKLSFATINKDVRILEAFARYAHNENYLLNMPRRVQPLQEETREPEAYAIDDIVRLLNAAKSEPGFVLDIPASLWWWSQLAAFYDTGLRRTVLMTRVWEDLNIESSWLRAPAGCQKQRAQQTKDIHPHTMAVLLTIRGFGHRHIWPNPHTNCWYYKHLHAIRRRANLSDLPRKPVHGLRASHATYIFEKHGIDASRDSCGHSTDGVTKKSYIDKRLLKNQPGSRSLPRPGAFSDKQLPLFE